MNYLSLHSFFGVIVFSLGSMASFGPSTSYNPLGIPVSQAYSTPLYNPGPGNLSPSFSYVQQPTIAPSQPAVRSGLSKDAKDVIGKWTLMADQNSSSPSKITGSVDQITRDRRILIDAEKAGGLTPQDTESIGQIKILLNLAEVRALVKLSSNAQEGFSDSFSATVGYSNKSSQTRQSKPLAKDWYEDKRNRLQTLLKDLQGFLNRNPGFAQNPPDLLVGLLTAYNEGKDALNKYNQFCNCLESPNLKGCTTLAQTSSKPKPSRNRNLQSWQQDREDDYESDDGEDSDSLQ